MGGKTQNLVSVLILRNRQVNKVAIIKMAFQHLIILTVIRLKREEKTRTSKRKMSVFICLAAITKYHRQSHSYATETYCSEFYLEAGSLRSPAWQGEGRLPSPTLLVVSHSVKDRELCGISFITALIPIMKALPHDLITTPQRPHY